MSNPELDEIFNIYVPKKLPNRAAFKLRLEGILENVAKGVDKTPTNVLPLEQGTQAT